MSIRILILEDDVDLGNLMKQYFILNDFHAHRVFNGLEAWAELKQNTYDMLIVDVMMPKEDGFTFAGKLVKEYPSLPFLFLTARKMPEDVLQGLKLGADDYMLKPFNADELILRVKNILKRAASNKETPTLASVTLGKYQFDPANLTLTINGQSKVLTEKESSLLHYLTQHCDRLIKREEILTHLWNSNDFFNGRSMDVFISRLRKYLAEDPAIQIESIRSVGFRFHCPR